MDPRWKGISLEGKALADAEAREYPISKLVSQIQSSLLKSKTTGFLSGHSALIKAEDEQARLLHFACFGKLISKNDQHMFQLSLDEAFYLCHSLKCLVIVGNDSCCKSDGDLWQYMKSKTETFPALFKAYSHLRAKNWVVMSGSLYGGDFVAYRHHPALVHSEYTVLVLSGGSNGNGRLRVWTDFQSQLRVCGSVAKMLLVVYVNKNGQGSVSPSCLERYSIEERIFTRWIPEQGREDKVLYINKNGHTVVSPSCLDSNIEGHVDNIQYASKNGMEVEDWASSSLEISDANVYLQDTNDEEHHCASGSISKLQVRKNISKARWNNEMGMAEVVERRGRMWTTTGIVRNSKLYCSIEETLFLIEVGALHLVDNNDTSLSLEDIYWKIAEGNNGCSWEDFQAYRHLKSLGYIVGRHGIPWTMKSVTTLCSTSESNKISDRDSEDKNSTLEQFDNMLIKETRQPVFDVYLPNSNFKKSSPGYPSFVLCSNRSYPPSKEEIEVLERQCGGISLLICHVEHGRVSFINTYRVELPVLS